MKKPSECSGVLVLNKEAGMTSHDAVNRIRRLFDTKQVGHTGTLDPMATGVLPILVGRAVKASEYLTSDQKEYIADLKLGLTTDTEDITGKILTSTSMLPSKEEVIRVCASFLGAGEQIPPMYSALKINGKKLVDLARQNIEVERPPRPIHIYSLDILEAGEEDGLYKLKVVCSKGTYIRTLCADIGKKLGCGGVMASLKRTVSGAFSLNDAYTLAQLEALSMEERLSLLHPVESLFESLPALSLSAFYQKLCSSGCPIYLKKLNADLPLGEKVRLYFEDRFFALGEVGMYEEGVAVKAIKQFVLFGKEGSPC